MIKTITNGMAPATALVLALLLASCATAPVDQEPRPAAEVAEVEVEAVTVAQEDEPGSMRDRFESEAADEAARIEAERQAAAEQAATEAAVAEAQAQAELEAAQRAAADELARTEALARAERETAEGAAAEAQALAEAQAQAEIEAAERAAAEELARADALAQTELEAAARAAETDRLEAEAPAAPAEPVATPQPVAVEDLPAIIPRTAENIARLGQDLTPMGSIRAGNAEGTIPAWDGGLTQTDWPAGYQPGDRHPNPYSGDAPLFTITGANYQDYADRLSVGQIAVFERYPESYFMTVYPTRRSASFPERIYQKTLENAETGRLIADGEGVADVAEGFPFPLPQNAYELMWNHKLKYKGIGGARYNNQVVPTASGSYQLIRLREELLGLYYKEGMTIEETNNILLYFFQEVESPARLAGNILLVHETLNQLEQPRQAWIYNPGQRRVRRAPNVAYDNPGTASDGLRTNDMTDMFNGAMDRYDWTIVGKREMYIPYNSYDAHSDSLTADDLVRPGHLNPEHMRYELHRVWVIDATLKPGTRHIHPRRTFYLDEDSYQIALIDNYDQRGELWRASEAHTLNYYDLPTYWSSIETHMDLQSGRYAATGLDNQDPVPSFNIELSPSAYTPQALRTRGRR